MDYDLLDTVLGAACSDDRDVCYSGQTTFVKLKYPVLDVFNEVANNLADDQWLLDDGGSVESFVESPDIDELTAMSGADKNHGFWSLLNLGLFGTHSTLYRGDEGLYLVAFSTSEVQTNSDPYYLLRSALSIDDSYDFERLLSRIDEDSYILSLTIGRSRG